jgi:hypothetical protein
VKLFFVLISAAVALFFTASHDDVRAWTPCHFRLLPLRCAAGDSNPAAAKDVNRVIAAAYQDHLDDTLLHVYVAVNRASTARKGTSAWAAAISEEVPGLAQRVGELTDAAGARVAAVEVETPAGRRFRAVALRGLLLEQLLYRGFAHDLAAKEPTLWAFNRWGTGLNQLHRWYVLQSQTVVAAAAPKDRAAVEAALLRY